MFNKKGYTIVEGIIAMLLVAVMVGAIFSSLMASRRAIIEPSYREEMLYAVESLQNQLKNYVDTVPEDSYELCGNTEPLSTGYHSCKEEEGLFPSVCQMAGDDIGYTVSDRVVTTEGGISATVNEIKITIICNGEVL